MSEKLWKICQAGNINALREFKEKHLNTKNEYMEWRERATGQTALMVATRYGRLDCVQLLLEIGAQVNAKSKDQEGNTPLHFAATMGHVPIVIVLLQHASCTPFLTNTAGLSPLESARVKYTVGKDTHVHQCIQALEEHFTIHKGWLQYANPITIGLNTWNRRFCLVMKTGNQEYLELAFYKATKEEYRTPCPCYVFWYCVGGKALEASSGRWFNTKRHAFKLTGASRQDGRLGDSTSIHLAAEDDYASWIEFFNVKSMSMVKTGDGDQERNKEMLEQQEALQQAMSLTRRISQGLVAPPPRSRESVSSTTSSVQSPAVPVINTTGIDDENCCVICMEAKPTAVCVPCGHNATCVECTEGVQNTSGLCPVCRTEIREVVRLFKA